jgi:hypothetical protein
VDPMVRADAYRASMLRTHAGRRRYTKRQMRRMRHKENRLFGRTGNPSVLRH